jgi:hypothetical protein
MKLQQRKIIWYYYYYYYYYVCKQFGQYNKYTMEGTTETLVWITAKIKGHFCPLQGPARSWGPHSFQYEPRDLKLITHIKRVRGSTPPIPHTP